MDQSDENSFFGNMMSCLEEKEKVTGYFKGNV